MRTIMTGSSGSNGLASWCFCGFSAIYHFILVEDLDQSEAYELSGGERFCGLRHHLARSNNTGKLSQVVQPTLSRGSEAKQQKPTSPRMPGVWLSVWWCVGGVVAGLLVGITMAKWALDAASATTGSPWQVWLFSCYFEASEHSVVAAVVRWGSNTDYV